MLFDDFIQVPAVLMDVYEILTHQNFKIIVTLLNSNMQ